jgi:hypothetical protein
MSWIKAAFLTGLLSSLMINFTPDGMAADWARGQGRGCQRGDRLNIQDLDMSPDPVTEGQRIRSWWVRVNFAGQRDCETDVMVREGNNIVGHARNYRMRPGLNELEIPVVENFRYTGREHCFNVQVRPRRVARPGRRRPPFLCAPAQRLVDARTGRPWPPHDPGGAKISNQI